MNTEAPSNVAMATDRCWHYLKDGKKEGPIPENEIAKMLGKGVLERETLVWSEPMTEWTPVSKIELFQAYVNHFPPPVPQTTILTSTESATRSSTNTVSQIRPWVRYWARLCDIYIYTIPCGVACGIVYPPLLDLPEIPLGMIVMLTWVLVEAWLLSTWGTTPGKWLLKTTVRDSAGRKLTFSEALKRSFLVYVKGFGLGLPGVCLITLIVAHTKLKREGTTSWDRDVGCIVAHERVKELRVVVAVLFLIGFIFLTAMVSV